MLLTVAPPVCVAKYSTTKTQEYRQTYLLTYGNGSSLNLNSVNAVKLENRDLESSQIASENSEKNVYNMT